MKYQLLAYLTIWGMLLTLGDIFFKKWAIDDKYLYYGLAIIAYIVGLIFFSFTLKEKNLAIASTILVTMNTITLVAVSYFYFHEKLTLIQAWWLALSIIGVILLEMGE
jgi:multidrug transporter EmrE-like cation transporter